MNSSFALIFILLANMETDALKSAKTSKWWYIKPAILYLLAINYIIEAVKQFS